MHGWKYMFIDDRYLIYARLHGFLVFTQFNFYFIIHQPWQRKKPAQRGPTTHLGRVQSQDSAQVGETPEPVFLTTAVTAAMTRRHCVCWVKVGGHPLVNVTSICPKTLTSLKVESDSQSPHPDSTGLRAWMRARSPWRCGHDPLSPA